MKSLYYTLCLSLLLLLCCDVFSQQKKFLVRNDEQRILIATVPIFMYDISEESTSLPAYSSFFRDEIFKSKKYSYRREMSIYEGKHEVSYMFDSVGRLIKEYKILTVNNSHPRSIDSQERILTVNYELGVDNIYINCNEVMKRDFSTSTKKWLLQYNKHKLIDTIIEAEQVNNHYGTKVLPVVKYYCVYDSVPRLLYTIMNIEGKVDTIEYRRYFVGDIKPIKDFLATTYKIKLKKSEQPIVVENKVTQNQYCYIKTCNKTIYLDNYKYLCVSGVNIKYNKKRRILSYSLSDYKTSCDTYVPCSRQCSQSSLTRVGNYFRTESKWSKKEIKTTIKLYVDWKFDIEDIIKYQGLHYVK